MGVVGKRYGGVGKGYRGGRERVKGVIRKWCGVVVKGYEGVWEGEKEADSGGDNKSFE